MHRAIWWTSQYIYARKCVSEYQSVFKVGVDKTVPYCARMNPKYGSLIIIHTIWLNPFDTVLFNVCSAVTV